MVEPAFDPLGAVAAVAEPVTFEFAVGRVTGEDERIHGSLPLQLEFCSNAEMGQKVKRSGGFLSLARNGYKTATKMTRFSGRDW